MTSSDSPSVGESEGDHVGVEAAAVEEDPGVGFAEERRRLVHDARRRADDAVLGELSDLRERGAVEAESPVLVEGERHRALDGGRRREAGADRHASS